MKLNLQARLVAAICTFKAKCDIRYYLNGVYVEPIPEGGALIVATNGHAMGIWRDKSGEIERPAILRMDKKLREACIDGETNRLILKDSRLAVLDFDGNEVYIQPNNSEDSVNGGWEVKGNFPDWRKVIPDKCEQGAIGEFNPLYLKMAYKALCIGGSSVFASVTLRQSEKDKAILASSHAYPEFAAVIMPVQSNDLDHYPQWLRNLKTNTPLESVAPAPAYDAIADGVVTEQKPEPAWHGDLDGPDPLYAEAVAMVMKHKKASVSMVQRILSIGYNRATRLIDRMEVEGIVSPMNPTGLRKILKNIEVAA